MTAAECPPFAMLQTLKLAEAPLKKDVVPDDSLDRGVPPVAGTPAYAIAARRMERAGVLEAAVAMPELAPDAAREVAVAAPGASAVSADTVAEPVVAGAGCAKWEHQQQQQQ